MARARARLLGLRDNLPNYLVSITYRDDFHEVLDLLESTGIDTVEFRVPDSQTGGRLLSSNIMTGQSRYSREQFVQPSYLKAKLDAVIHYLGFDNSAKPMGGEKVEGSAGNTFNVHAGVVNIAQSQSGDIYQQAGGTPDVKAVRDLLGELELAIANMEATQEERDSFAEPVSQLRAELSHERPLLGRLMSGWGAVKAFATLQGAWAGLDHVQTLAAQVAPQVEAIIRAATTS